MKLAKYIITLITIVCGYAAAVAQPKSVMKSYNFSRALEEAQKGNKADALDFFQKEVAENPSNGYAYLSMAVLQADAEDYSSAMTSMEKAIKKLPKKDKEWTSCAYASRAHLYTIAGDTISALADFAQAIKINHKDADFYETLGQLFYELNHHVRSDDDLEQLRAIPAFEELMQEFDIPVVNNMGNLSCNLRGFLADFPIFIGRIVRYASSSH